MSLVVRNRDQVTASDYRFVRENVEAMTDDEIMSELGVSRSAVETLRIDLGLMRRSKFGKVNSKGIERAKDFEARVKRRLRDEGVNGEEARYFMAEILGARIGEINMVEHWSKLHNETNGMQLTHRTEIREIADEYMDVLKKYR